MFRKECLYNKALATTLEGSRKFLGGTSSRSGCDETGSATEIWGYIRKIQKVQNSRTGSGVIQMGSYFGKMTPRGSGSFLDLIFGLPMPKKYKKCPHSYRLMPGFMVISIGLRLPYRKNIKAVVVLIKIPISPFLAIGESIHPGDPFILSIHHEISGITQLSAQMTF